MSPAEDRHTVVQIAQTGEWDLPLPFLERAILAALRQEEVEEGEISLTFLDDDSIRTLNRDYLGRDRPTDVIVFSLHDPGDPLVGDIYVGYEQAARQCGAEGVDLREELIRLTIHGVLHVLGHDHPPGEDRWSSPMFRLQEEILSTVLHS